jgi:hypothetical protein
MKFKNYIETESGIKDTSTSPGTAGQVLSSTVTGTSWIDPDTLVSAASKLVVIACKNTSGSTINKGTPVYQTGTVGATDVIEVAPADALISSGSQPAIGLLQTTLNNNGLGNVVITGELLNFTTDPIDGVTPTTGDKIFLKSGGGLTLTKPTGEGNAIQNLGLIGKVSGGNAGSITVSSIMRANDVPNLPTGKIWVGDGNTIVSDTVYLDETNERMGIGTTSPQEKMHVSGSSNIRLEVEATDSTVAALKLTNTAGSYASFVNASGSLSTYDYNAASTRTTLLANGNFGLGTTSPSSRLDVLTSSSGPVATLKNTSGTGGSGLAVYGGTGSGSNILTLYDKDSNQRLEVTGEGNVGIGTTSPSEKLEVNGTVKATASTDAYKGYIKQTITSSANEKVDNADYNLVPYNTLTTVSSDQSYNRMVAAYDGRIKKVYIRNTSGTVTADAVNFKKQINNTTAATVYSATVANAASAGMSAVYNFADSDFTFNEGDTFGILYQTVDSVGGASKMAGVAINVIVEYNIT